MKPEAPKLFGTAMMTVLTELGIGNKVKEYEVLDLWPQIVGEQIARVAIADRIDDGKLFIKVSRATWRNELIFLKKEIIHKINESFSQEIIKEIIFR